MLKIIVAKIQTSIKEEEKEPKTNTSDKKTYEYKEKTSNKERV